MIFGHFGIVLGVTLSHLGVYHNPRPVSRQLCVLSCLVLLVEGE